EGKFVVNGKEYQVPKNEKFGSLHGGKVGFDKAVWDAEICGEELVLSLLSPDGDQEYPGNLKVTVKYSFTGDNELKLDYSAVTDADTPISLTNHCYFNLSGQGTGTILDTVLTINSDYITPVDSALLTDGRFMVVAGTPFDFRTAKEIGRDINADFEQVKFGGGFDHNFVLNIKGYAKFATAISKRTGIVMDCYTDQPGVQFYSGNFMGGSKGKGGTIYNKRDAFCLETQNYPNAVNCPEYPNSILKAGEEYHTVTVYKFSVEK
ncbi:MAG: galactose mutarotase, partial [Clostridia bacterium]|nr:galactose mutarotase [Clostridia bacterium]